MIRRCSLSFTLPKCFVFATFWLNQRPLCERCLLRALRPALLGRWVTHLLQHHTIEACELD